MDSDFRVWASRSRTQQIQILLFAVQNERVNIFQGRQGDFATLQDRGPFEEGPEVEVCPLAGNRRNHRQCDSPSQRQRRLGVYSRRIR